MRLCAHLALLAALGFGSMTAFWASSASADGASNATCGSKENPCPLQKWMQANIGSKMADGNMKGVAEGLDKAVSLNPDPSWSEWATISKAGAEAARKNDTAGVKASCKSCHDKYKQQYKDKFRARAVP